MLKTVFLDFDNTIHDSNHRYRYCLNNIEKRINRKLKIQANEIDELRYSVSKKYKRKIPKTKFILNLLIRKYKIDINFKYFWRIWKFFEKEYWGNNPKMFSDVLGFLKFSHKKFKTCLLTGNTIPKRKKHLVSLKILKYFDYVIAARSFNKRKGSLDVYRIALKKTKSRPRETIMIGDSPRRDIIARKIGINTILIKRNIEKDLIYKPDFIVNSLTEAKKIIRCEYAN